MKPLPKQILAVGFLLTAAILIGGCIFIDGANLKAKWEKAEDHTVPLASGTLIQVETHNGVIVVRGADTQQCRVEAKIQVRAETEEIAQEIAKQTQILLQEANHKLIIKLDKPTTTEKHSISVDYTITAPHQASVHAVSHNGKLQFSDLQGNINGNTHNGKVVCLQIQGAVSLETHNGSIHSDLPVKVQGELSKNRIQGVIGNGMVQLHTHNGSIRIY